MKFAAKQKQIFLSIANKRFSGTIPYRMNHMPMNNVPQHSESMSNDIIPAVFQNILTWIHLGPERNVLIGNEINKQICKRIKINMGDA